jgi:hypothetical protein
MEKVRIGGGKLNICEAAANLTIFMEKLNRLHKW